MARILLGVSGGIGLELVDEHGGAADPLEGRLAHEPQAGGRLHHPHGVPRRGGEADDLNGLVGGDAAGDADQQARHGASSG